MFIGFEDKGDALCQARTGSNKVLVDVPRTIGGKDRAMTPTELLVVALGSCVNAMIIKYCHGKDLSSEGTRIKVHFEELEEPMRLGNFKIEIKLPDSLKEHQDGIDEFVSACTVHKTMEFIGDITKTYA